MEDCGESDLESCIAAVAWDGGVSEGALQATCEMDTWQTGIKRIESWKGEQAVEIGGYLEFERYNGGEYYPDLLHLNTTRNAILLAILEKGYKKVRIPKYLGSSVRGMLFRENIPFETYRVTASLTPDFSDPPDSDEGVLLVNYFGQLGNAELKSFLLQYSNVIIDNTQAFFQQPVRSLDTVYNCHKYFGVADGAYLSLSGSSKFYSTLQTDRSHLRMQHLLGRFECSAAEYYDTFRANDDALNYEPIKKMSRLTQNILGSISYRNVVQRRSKNFDILHKALHSVNQMEVKNRAGLYMYPLLLEQGHALKKELIRRQIYVPTLWPNVLDECRPEDFEYKLADNLVPLPIDQRYDASHMNYMLRTIRDILKDIRIVL